MKRRLSQSMKLVNHMKKSRRTSRARRNNDIAIMKGGSCGTATFPSSFSNVPIHSFYPLNTYQSDPNYYNIDSRNVPM
jgi:hypothetical protein